MPAFPPLLARLARYSVLVLVAVLLAWAATWQGWLFPSDRQYLPRRPNPNALAVPPGYRAEVLASGLNAPSALEVTPSGEIFIGESGYGGAYAATAGYEGATPGRILRLNRDGSLTAVAGGFKPPLSGFLHAPDGTLFVSHNGTVSAITPVGRRDILTGLPSLGDHKNNNLALGPDGKLYLLQGTVTNSGIVGLDNWVLWGRFFPAPHDIPCQDITLRGVNVKTADPRSLLPFSRVQTGAFSPFGHTTRAGQLIRGQLPCNGAVMRLNTDGSGLELVAWGLRNPFDLRFGQDGALYLTDNGFDTRGSRPVHGDDLFHRIEAPGLWYGWPDYWNGRPVEAEKLLARAPGEPARAFATLGYHTAAAGFDFAPAAFGFEGQAFIARWGSGFPATNQRPDLAGFDIVRLNPANRKLEVFARNTTPGPASLTADRGGLERPTVVRFGPDGAMYVLDWGHLSVTRKGPYHVPDGGVLWRITKEGTNPLPYTYRPQAPRRVARPGLDARPLFAACVLGAAGFLFWRRRRTF